MSFASDVKEEVCKGPLVGPCCSLSELYGVLLNCQVFSHTYIKIVTENYKIAKRIQALLKKTLNIAVSYELKNNKYLFEIENPMQIEKIFESFGYDHKYYIHFSLNRNIIDKECCVSSFLRGVFLMSGTVNHPTKKSHLEISTSHNILAREIMSVMLDYDMKPKISKRKNNEVIYFKDSIEVEEFLTRIKATNAAMMFMQEKALKEIRNSVNRRVNCETANLSKTIDAAAKQIDMINRCIEQYGLDIFPENLHKTIHLRINNPELSLVELGELHNPVISKSAINHRMRKILKIAKETMEGA